MESRLSYLDDSQRLIAYETITKGCIHLWSKNKLQQTKLEELISTFSHLAEKDPLFLAHFTSYVINKLDSKDLKVVATFANSLSDADGTPFSAGSEYKKPNWRMISQAALCRLDPKLTMRVVRIANSKMKFGSKAEATHFSKHLKTALCKYLRYREANPKLLEGVRKAGLKNTVETLYRIARIAPSPEAVRILGWKQKPGFPGSEVELKKTPFNFEGMSDLEIAQKIQGERLPPTGVLGALPRSISPVIAAAILEQSTGNQVVVLTEMFEEQGLLKNDEVRKVYQEKLKTAKTALDRVERFKVEMDEQTAAVLKTAKSEQRKEDVGDLGKFFLNIDISGSMSVAVQVAIDKGSILAECIKNPSENFFWGVFNTSGSILVRPKTFEKDAFAHSLYGIRPTGGTDCLALYAQALRLGCTTLGYVTDQEHNGPPINVTVDKCRKAGLPDPKMVVIIDVGHGDTTLKRGFESCGIPVAVLKPEQLSESALVSQAVKSALKGASAIIEEIMSEPLLQLPKWWCSVNT